MINTQELKTILGKLYPVVPAKTTMPILKTIAMRSENGRIAMTVNDLTTSLTLYLQSADILNCCVPAKPFNEIAKLLNSNEIEIVEDNNFIVIKKNPGKATLHVLNLEEFPVTQFNNEQDSIKIDAVILANSLKKCAISMSPDLSHPVLNGMLLQSENNTLTLASADGFRMTTISLTLGLPDFYIILPYDSVAPLISILNEQSIVYLNTTQNVLTIWNENFIFTSQLVSGNFPDFTRIIPASYTQKLTIGKTQLLNALRQALVYSVDSSNLTHLELNSEKVTISGESSEYGTSVTPIENGFEYTGQALEIALNGRYLEQATGLAQEKIVLKFNGATSPIGVYFPESESLTHILMPMHIGRR